MMLTPKLIDKVRRRKKMLSAIFIDKMTENTFNIKELEIGKNIINTLISSPLKEEEEACLGHGS